MGLVVVACGSWFTMKMKVVILLMASFLGMNSWELLVYKNCMENCRFVLIQLLPTVLERRLPTTNSYYYSNCCSGIRCNDGGPTNVERDLLPPLVIEEQVIARAVYLGESNLLLSLALVLSSNILT